MACQKRHFSNPVVSYLRSRLRRRLFAWFGITIFGTAVLFGAAMWLLAGDAWHTQMLSVEHFVGDRFADVWHSPEAREQLARAAAEDLRVGITLFDPDGVELGTFGRSCEHVHELVVRRDGVLLGRVRACPPQWHTQQPRWLLALCGLAATMLWLASGIVAFKLTAPLEELVKVTKALGRGELDARMRATPTFVGDLRVLSDVVNDMAARIQRMVATERELLASVSHELRTPLGHIRVLLEMARAERNDGGNTKLVDELDSEVVAIDNLVAQLLARSRVEFGNLDKRPLDAVALAVRALERADLDLTLLEAEDAELRFSGDAALVLQSLANLLRNATEHGGGVKRLVVRNADGVGTDADTGSGTVVFEVEDEGPGFEDHELHDAFESFHQGRHGDPQAGSEALASTGKGALGLGLALVKRIATAHQGRAWARNLRPGAAVGFSVRR